MGNFLRRYIVTRQKEGGFAKCEPNAAITYIFGAIAQFAMSRFLFGIKDIPLDDEQVVKELVALILRGLKK